MTMKTSRKKTKPITDPTPPETSPAAVLIANSVDLLAQVLLRLPAKPLIRFKSVSKHWLALLSDSHFAYVHSRLNPKPLISSLYFRYNKKLDSVSLNGSPTFPSLSFLRPLTGDITILHSCNGLLLIKKKQTVDNLVKVQYIVCNPTTQKFHLIGQKFHRVARRSGRFYKSGCLAFDPSKSPHYKVVLLRRVSYPSLEMHIFSSETASWKKIFLTDRCYRNGAFWNGAIYWLCDQYNLLRFDVETEKMIGMPYTPSSSRVNNIYKTRYFGDCGRGGRLLLIESHSHSTVRFKICEMDKDYCCWNVKFRVDLKTLISEFPVIESKRRYKFTVLCVVEGEKEDDFSLIFAIPGKIISCNPQERTWNVLRDLTLSEYSGFIKYGYAIVFPFVESLSPV
ncbi:F-box protein At5g07610-like [Rhododendron vialii]|uniref:F-box protein At5g07610-like n=1 Tax=Rhododendron vialii TaxID=182163 RepID=UPI00265F3CE7|nr:F-box protein At5g07610-like [Rhododendron vialii]